MRYSAVFRARVKEKEQHTAKLLKFLNSTQCKTLQWHIIEYESEWQSMEHVQKQHFSFNLFR